MWNPTENKIVITMIRHGETPANKEHRYLGRTDEYLSDEGKEKLLQLKREGYYPSAEVVFVSPMKRCLETVQLLYPDSKPIIIPEWKEMDFGAFEGKNYRELQGDERYQAWIDSNGTLPFPDGESREDFVGRCKQGFSRMLAELRKLEEGESINSRNVALIVHGGTIMSLLSSFYGGEYFDYQVPNGRGYLCELEEVQGENIRLVDIEKL